MRIRIATPDDVVPIARIHVAAWHTTYRGLIADELLANLDASKNEQRLREIAESTPPQLFVLEDDSHVLGFCHIAPAGDDDTDDRVGEIITLYLNPSSIGRGYGRRLCEHALEQLKEQGFSEVVLWVFRQNHAARAFYERLGFVLDGADKFLEKLQVEGVRYRIRLSRI